MAEVPSGVTESRGAEHCSLSLYATALSPGITSGYTPQQGVPRNNLLVENNYSLFTQSKENHPALIITTR